MCALVLEGSVRPHPVFHSCAKLSAPRAAVKNAADRRLTPKGTKGYQRVPKGTKGYQRVPKGTKGYQRVPKGTVRILWSGPPLVVFCSFRMGHFGAIWGYLGHVFEDKIRENL